MGIDFLDRWRSDGVDARWQSNGVDVGAESLVSLLKVAWYKSTQSGIQTRPEATTAEL